MRKLIAVLGFALLGVVGCHHIGGKCDCGPQPGEAILYAPFHGYQNVAPEAIPAPKETLKK